MSVTSGDIVRAIEREADPDASVGGYNFYYSIIDGFSDFGDGKADSISGLETPDESTLVVHLSEPAGYLPYLFAMAATAPIPPNGDAPLGAAEGHTRDYGRFLVATGPYQFAGSENLDFSLPPDEQTPVAGYEPGKSVVLVRNPNYDASTDGLRPAYPDGFTIAAGRLFHQLPHGALEIHLVPGTYQVIYQAAGIPGKPGTAKQTETWVVPETPGPFTIAEVKQP